MRSQVFTTSDSFTASQVIHSRITCSGEKPFDSKQQIFFLGNKHDLRTNPGYSQVKKYLGGGGNSNIFLIFTPTNWRNDPNFDDLTFFRWVETQPPFLDTYHTVDGRNPAPPGIHKTL